MSNTIQISAKTSFLFAWEKFKLNWKKLSLISIITILVSTIFSAVHEMITFAYRMEASQTMTEAFWPLVAETPAYILAASALINLLSLVVSMIFTYNLMKIALKVYDDQEFTVRDIFQTPDSRFWKWLSLAAVLITPFVISFGIIALVPIPFNLLGLVLFAVSIYFGMKYSFAYYLLVDGKSNSIADALQKSAQMSHGSLDKIFWFYLATGLLIVAVIFVGLLALVVGVMPALIIVLSIQPIAYIHMYRTVYAAKMH